jgi:hypothetical protein
MVRTRSIYKVKAQLSLELNEAPGHEEVWKSKSTVYKTHAFLTTGLDKGE